MVAPSLQEFCAQCGTPQAAATILLPCSIAEANLHPLVPPTVFFRRAGARVSQLQLRQNVNLVSQEGDKFEVSREIAMMSNLVKEMLGEEEDNYTCLLYTSPSPRDRG